MTKCPKCDSIKIIGPCYQKDLNGEHLVYRCFQCGYVSTTPCEDAGKIRTAPDWKIDWPTIVRR